MYISNQDGGVVASQSLTNPIMKYRTVGQNLSHFLDISLQEQQGEGQNSRKPSGNLMERCRFGQDLWMGLSQNMIFPVDRSDDVHLLKSMDNIDESCWFSADAFAQEQTFCTYTLQDGTELSYCTIYEPDRIYCIKDGEEDVQWEIPLQDESQYDKVISFLNELEDRDNQSFTIHNTFWQDFLSGQLAVDAFKEYLDTRGRDGISNGFHLTEDGADIDREAAKYSIYLYGSEFGAHLMRSTEEVLEWQRQQMGKVGTVQSSSDRFSQEQVTALSKKDYVLGIGFLNSSGKISYGMRAEYAEHSTSDRPVIKVTIQKEGGLEEVLYVDLQQVDTRNATEIEMFALCCYADDTGNGTGGTFGTWQDLNYYRTNASDIGIFRQGKSWDTCLSLRQNWVLMIEKMRKIYWESGLYRQSRDGALLLGCLA